MLGIGKEVSRALCARLELGMGSPKVDCDWGIRQECRRERSLIGASAEKVWGPLSRIVLGRRLERMFQPEHVPNTVGGNEGGLLCSEKPVRVSCWGGVEWSGMVW